MKLFVLGKVGGVLHWTEDSVAGFRIAGHEVRLGITRNPRLNREIERILLARWASAPRAIRTGRAITAFAPDLVLVIAANLVPLPILEHVAALPRRPPLVGWIGDRLSAADRAAVDLFDAVAYTDSGLLALHTQLGFASRATLVHHAANPRLDRGVARGERHSSMVFVANPTPHRLAMIEQVRTPLRLCGPGWQRLGPTDHQVEARRVGVDELAGIYRSHIAVLNIRHEHNVLNGLNQRHFDPYFAATPVVADDQVDLPRCFEPGREILVYSSADELNDIYSRLRREPDWAAAIGAAGRRRMLAQHTYEQRLIKLAELV